MEIDLNEDNYDYQRLVELFSLQPTFSKYELKSAKLKVLKLHPDKSGLPPNIYLFMSKMYYKLEEVYSFTNHEIDKNTLSVEYDTNEHFKNYLHENDIDPVKDYKTFSKEFNKMFDNVYISENGDGYEEWFKSDEDMYDKDNLEKSREDALAKSADIIPCVDIEEVGMSSSNIFKHADIKESYINPFVALDINKVYNDKPKFASVQEYQTFIKKDELNTNPSSNEAGIKYIKHKENLLNSKSKSIAFEHIQQKEKMEAKYDKYISTHLRLKE